MKRLISTSCGKFLGKRSLLLVAATAAIGLAPLAQARDWDYRGGHDRDWGHHDDYSSSSFNIDIRIGDRPRPVPVPAPVPCDRVERVWVDPVYRTVSDRVWVPAEYRTVTDRVWRAPVTEDRVVDRVWVEPVYEVQTVWHTDYCGRPYSTQDRVCVRPGRWEERRQQVVVREGYWENVSRQELVCDGHWQNVDRQELVAPGHWEDRVVTVDATPRYDRGDRYRW